MTCQQKTPFSPACSKYKILFLFLVDALGYKKGKGPVRIELMQVICLFLSSMENVGSNVLPTASSERHNWKSIFFQYDECHRKRSCLPLFFSLALWFKLVKVYVQVMGQ